ncbi:4Fe-4S dicluster domain-containing protein [Desulfovirgula thermocuniculi]|uniref:4Fe-4S dicluster domain-containing protein n=1 Tax=Desulfovirgula thermocuniculi TaxID=348842 RepID=UPI0003FD641F|nr:4Fe-4S dicluster domain-containing protein [Desulfovirgula thermocuniculi]
MAEEKMVSIYIMGKQYKVPYGLTIMKAMEYAGYRFIRGCGCRGGFCGACGTVYRKPGDFRLKVGLACQTMVEDGMHLTQIPFYPANKATYNLEELTPTLGTLLTLYPEMTRCLGCNSCTRICPQELSVMDYMAAAQRGDIEKVAHMSFECIMCGLCASRCPAEIVQYNVALLCRRLYGRHIAPRAQHLAKRVEEIKAGKFDEEIEKLMKMSKEELQKLYNARDIEP